ncbi:peptidylprolyl isomerase [Ichthyobacterium seriolicida]|uniref:Survival protein SurA n=1 Tax=Ichthyobacterium seriolicida TaxID=242600 RepID=A0A1J1E850_9FLAO|nr:peptidylprolyl isomerase [Ichthyobacterium seriolicida]BAV94107.1 survival protein SurA precursor [Ichthyobacterium seriolicida]
MIIRKIQILLIFSTLANLSFAQDKVPVDEILAVVGERIILKSDLQKQLLNLEYSGVEITDKTKCELLETLMFEKLLSHQAVIDSLKLPEGQVSESVKSRMNQLIARVGSVKKLEELYNKTESDIKEDMFSIVEDQLLAHMMQQEVISSVDITPEEVKNYFNKIPKDSLPEFPTEVELLQIVKKPFVTEKSKEKIIAKLKEIKASIENGDSFKTKAILYSEDEGSSAKGGEYKGVKRGQFVKPFESVAFNLSENEISQPFETKYGFHIVQLLKRRGEELDLRHILIKYTYDTEALEEARASLDSLRSKIQKGDLTFEEAVSIHSDDMQSKFDKGKVLNPLTRESSIELKSIDPDISYAIKNLSQGDISEVVYRELPEKKIFVIYKLHKKKNTHKASLSEDFQKLKTLALEAKQNSVSEKWVQERITKTFTKIDDKTKCNFKQNWRKK